MPRVLDRAKAAFDILDLLFFNQTVLFSLLETKETDDDDSSGAKAQIALVNIVKQVNSEVAATGLTEVSAQALKHTVYCLLEAGFVDNLATKSCSDKADSWNMQDIRGVPISKLFGAIDQSQAALADKYNQQFVMAAVVAIGKQFHGVCGDTACSIATSVSATFRNAPTEVKYRLTERVLLLEFMDAPAVFLSWMHRVGVLKGKFVARVGNREISNDFKARIGLICEFTLMRRYFARTMMPDKSANQHIYRFLHEVEGKLSESAWSELHQELFFNGPLHGSKTYELEKFTFDLGRLNDEKYLNNYLEHFAEKYQRNRFWTGGKHSWVGIVAAGMIWGHHSLIDSKVKLWPTKKSSKSGDQRRQENYVSETVREILMGHGLSCEPLSLRKPYETCYTNQPDGLYRRAAFYRYLIQTSDIVYSVQDFDPYYFAVIASAS